MEAVIYDPAAVTKNRDQIERQKRRHRRALVQRCGMTKHAVAKIMRPRQARRRPIGEIVET